MKGIDNREHTPPLHAEPEGKPGLHRAEPPQPEFSDVDREELRFSLRELFLATTVAAVMLALFRSVGIFGAVFSFLSAVILTLLVIPRWCSTDRARQRIYFDFVWGIVMPVVCLVFDPFVFKHGDFDGDPLYWVPAAQPGTSGNISRIQVNAIAYFAWPMLAGQIVTLSLVLGAGKLLRPVASLVAGILAVGMMISFCLAALLSIPAALGTLLFGIGLLGFTPLFTCCTYYRRMRLMWLIGGEGRTYEWKLTIAALGVLLCLAMAVVTGTIIQFAVSPNSPVSF